ncbi:hypothetical protein [Curtobacterium sp. VKM Ac-1395]|uniref:hypothetical protein n=1 Tax=Curtobacterium sp. VKM Ac-1395 TaxID=2783815 RepID=UPI00188D85CC|nr:hypothetical protein [Curtobacterium sp. VKM Ac-1395]MBF4590429.1 hypothetical protein [Curtobacterium sp. VKM Ac-1395]
MSDGHEEANETPRRFRTLRPDLLRDVFPWVVVAVGIIQSVQGGIDLAHGGSPAHMLIGLGLAVLGIVVFLINRWQARRGL